MYQPIHDPQDIIEDLKNHNVDMKDFDKRLKAISGGVTTNQFMFEFLWSTYKLNNYKI